MVHSYGKTGEYTIKFTVTQGRAEPLVTEKTIFAYEKFILLITDAAEEKSYIDTLVQSVRKDGIYINVIESYDATTAFMSEEALTAKLTEQEASLSSADFILVWRAKGSGIDALTRMSRERPPFRKSCKTRSLWW